jgi:hypothetical protein
MRSIENLKLGQLRKLFTMFKISLIQSLNIFETREDICFVFQNLEKFEIHLEKFKPIRTHLAAAHFQFNRAARLPRPTPACHLASHHQ